MATKKKLSKKAERELKARQLETRAAKTIIRAVGDGRVEGANAYEVIRAAIMAAVPGRQKYPNIEKPLLDGTKAAAAAIRRIRRRSK